MMRPAIHSITYRFPSRHLLFFLALAVIATVYSLHRLHDSVHVSHAGLVGSDVPARKLIKGTGLRHERETSSISAAYATPDSKPIVTTDIKPLVMTRSGSAPLRAGTPVATSATSSSSKKVFLYNHTELWGDVIQWGPSNKKGSVEECCQQCCDHVADLHANPDALSCNVCVFCGNKEKCGATYGECWLKHLVHADAVKPANQGPSTPWTAGTIGVDLNYNPLATHFKSTGERKFHTVTSAQGAAVHWQCRIHYYWYLKQKAACEKAGGCDMGGWTRLLHSGKADDLMDELPTMVVDPLPSDKVEHSWYVVLNRPYAFAQWVKAAKIPERFVYMAEPDHIMLRPIPNLMTGDTPASFPFFYIEPAKKETENIVRKFTGPATRAELEEIAPIGNSPTFMTFDDMKKTMDMWMNISIDIFQDTEATKAWGWVQEMYGFAIALWKVGIKKVDLFLHLMAQPPWDTNMEMAPGRPFYILHYTYGMDYKKTGEFSPGKFGEWRYDKRSFMHRPMPRNVSEPPTGMKNDLVRTLINSFNEATAAIPCWDEYAKTGKVPMKCDEKPGGFLAELAGKGQE